MIVYYGLTEDEIKRDGVYYRVSFDYRLKMVNLSLDGLRRFILDNNMQDIIKYYTVLDSSIFEIDDSVYTDGKYDDIAVKIPYSFKVDQYYKLF